MGAGGVWNRPHKHASIRVQHFHLRGMCEVPPKNHRPFTEPKANSDVHDATSFGVLKLTLKPKGYDW
jgi:hypothetical protein